MALAYTSLAVWRAPTVQSVVSTDIDIRVNSLLIPDIKIPIVERIRNMTMETNETIKSEVAVTGDKISLEEQAQVDLLAARERGIECAGRLGKVNLADVTLYSENPRPADEFDVADMVTLYGKFGYRPEFPITVSVRKDGTTVSLRGNRRVTAALTLRDTQPEVFARVFPKGEIPAIIHKGLTESEEMLLAVDHSTELDRKALSAWGVFRAIAGLMGRGEVAGRYAIAEKLGLVKVQTVDGKTVRTVQGPYVQKRMELARLPEFVQVAYKQAPMFGGKDTRYQQAEISKLLKIYNKERDTAAKLGKATGPEFDAKWDSITNPKLADGADSADGEGGILKLTRKQFADRAVSCKSLLVKQCMEVAGGVVDATIIGTLDNRGCALEEFERNQTMIFEFVGPDGFADLLGKAKVAYAAAHPVVTAAPAATVSTVPSNGITHTDDSEDSEVPEADEVLA
jgi:hypothetical protein